MGDVFKNHPGEGTYPEGTPSAIPRDPSSGRFIVADILPPRKPDVRLTAMPEQIKKRAVKKPSAKKSSAKKVSAETPSEKNPFLSSTKKESLDMWFQKRKKSFDVPAPPPSDQTVFRQTPSSWKRVLGIVFILTALTGGGIYAFGQTFAKMHITLGLKSETHVVQKEIIIATDGREGSISGEVITISHPKQESFPATGHDTVETKAHGTITIYNAFSSQEQVLVANTRFEAPDGKIYRIQKPITVPGAGIKDGKIVPNSIDVTVYADTSGEEYNKDSADFTIPGFKGSPRFEGFYARTKTSLTGGFIGETNIITEKDRDAAEELLKNMAREEAYNNLKEAVPEEFILLDDAYEILTEENTFSPEAGDPAEQFTGSVVMEGRALIFRTEDLGAYLANALGLPSDRVHLANTDDISLSVVRRSLDAGTLVLEVTGPVQFLWNFSEDALVTDVLGAPSPDVLHDIFATYAAIDHAEVRFSPKWVRLIPPDRKNIVLTKEITDTQL